MRLLTHWVILLLIGSSPDPSSACTYAGGVKPISQETQDWTLSTALEKSPVILVAQVVETVPKENRARILVKRPLKGATPKEFWLKGFAFDGLTHSGLCNYKRLNRVEVGWTYLMFMDRLEEEGSKIYMHRWLETDRGQRSPLDDEEVREVERGLATQP